VDIRRKHLLVLALLALVYYAPGVFSPRDFWVADEARYAQVVREALADGQWLVPHLNGFYYTDKPPLYFWLAGLISMAVSEITPWAFTVISGLSALACILASYVLGASIFSPSAAFLGSAVLMSTFVFLFCAEIVRMDMLFAAFVTAAILSFYHGYESRQRRWYCFFYAGCGLAVMTKGPLGLAFPLAAAVLWLVARREWREIGRFLGHWGWLLPAVMVGGWLGTAAVVGSPEFVAAIFRREIAGRAFRAFSHPEPFYFYALVLPFVLLPWSPFAVGAWRQAWRERRSAAGLLTWWFLGGFVIISAISGKLFIYVLPLMPPLALLMGNYLDNAIRQTVPLRGIRIATVIAVLAAFGPLAAMPLVVRRFAPWPEFTLLPLAPLGWLFAGLLVCGLVFCGLRKVREVLFLLFAGLWLFSCYAFQVVAPKANHLCSARQIARAMTSLAESGHEVATSGVQRGILNFYAQKIIPELSRDEVRDYLDKPGSVIVLPEKHYRHLVEQATGAYRILGTYFIVDTRYHLVTRGE